MSARHCVAILVGCLFVVSSPLRAMDGPWRVARASDLVERALAADAAGDTHLHQQLLRRALQIDPDFELARWHLGEVFFCGKWRSLESIGQIVSGDPRWQEYRERVQATDDSPEAHAALARWCRREGLEIEEKLHWRKVLESAPEHREALGRLGVKRFADGFYRPDEIEELKQRRELEQAAYKRHQREFKRMLNQGRRGDRTVRDEILVELAAVDDPAAVPALMEMLAKTDVERRTSDVTRKRSFNEQVSIAVVNALSNIEEHTATLKLIDIAVFSKQSSVRREAAMALRYREPTSYMPVLMANLVAPIEWTYDVLVAPSGQVSLIEEVFQDGPESQAGETRTSEYLTRYIVSARDLPNGNTRGPGPVTLVSDQPRDLQQAANRAEQSARRVAKENATIIARNTRIREVLEIATDSDFGDDPKAWWTAWQQYNELYVPETLPYDEREFYDDFSSVINRYRPSPSCFVAGTPVWTQSGPVAIEQIQVGELVLSQDPITGRLNYKPIVATTVRPPTAVLQLDVDGETITTTLGHRFWVTGEGWRMAKFLGSDDRLFSTRGSRRLQSVTAVEQAEAYNLVVGDYHTYFVGNSRLLVHDNQCPQPIAGTMLGVSADDWDRVASR